MVGRDRCSRETVRRDLIPSKLVLCCLIVSLTLNGLASLLPKMKSGSRTIILITPSNGVTWIEILSSSQSDHPWQKRDAVFSSARKDRCTGRSSEEVKLLTPLSFANNWRKWRSEFLPITYGRAKSCSWWTTWDRIMRKSPLKTWRTSKWSGYLIHPIPWTSFCVISMHIEGWKTSVTDGTSRTVRTWSWHCGFGSRPGLETSGGEDSNCQNDGEQLWEHVESTTTMIAGIFKLLILAIKLKFWKDVITCVSL